MSSPALFLKKRLKDPLRLARLKRDVVPEEDLDEFDEIMRQRVVAREQYIQENDGQISLESLFNAYHYCDPEEIE